MLATSFHVRLSVRVAEWILLLIKVSRFALELSLSILSLHQVVLILTHRELLLLRQLLLTVEPSGTVRGANIHLLQVTSKLFSVLIKLLRDGLQSLQLRLLSVLLHHLKIVRLASSRSSRTQIVLTVNVGLVGGSAFFY